MEAPEKGNKKQEKAIDTHLMEALGVDKDRLKVLRR